jgi:hypothetical protein
MDGAADFEHIPEGGFDKTIHEPEFRYHIDLDRAG